MNRIAVSLVFLMLVGACSTGQKAGQKKFTIRVFDRHNNQPIDSARVTLVSIVEARDIFTDIKYTDSVGLCSFSLIFNPKTQYQVGTKKDGFFSYLGDDSADMIRSYAMLNEQTKDNLVLYLTSDSLHQKNYWAKKTIRFDPDTLIKLLKTDNYPRSIGLPLLSWKDIPVLLTIGNDTSLITHFPSNPVSSTMLKECYTGMIALWFIESIRISETREIVHPFEKFPSQTPILRDIHEPVLAIPDIEKMEIAYRAYVSWWKKTKNMEPSRGSEIDPLENTDLKWR